MRGRKERLRGLVGRLREIVGVEKVDGIKVGQGKKIGSGEEGELEQEVEQLTDGDLSGEPNNLNEYENDFKQREIEVMEKVTREIAEVLPVLWKIGVQRTEGEKILDCLVACSQTIRDVMALQAR